MVTFKRCIYVHPFHEEDPIGLVKLIGADNVLFGSDYPHPEGMYDPIGFVDQLDGLPEDDKAKVMGGNLNRIMKVPALASSGLSHAYFVGVNTCSRSMHSTVSAGIVT